MHIRDLVKQKWADEGLYASQNPKIQAFLKYIDENSLDCWDEYIKVFRDEYYDLFDELIPPLMKTQDKLLRLTLIRKADLKKRKELNLLKEFVRKADSIADEPELLATAKLGHKGLTAELRKRKDLTDELRRILQPPPTTSKAAKNIVISKRETIQANSKKPEENN